MKSNIDKIESISKKFSNELKKCDICGEECLDNYYRLPRIEYCEILQKINDGFEHTGIKGFYIVDEEHHLCENCEKKLSKYI